MSLISSTPDGLPRLNLPRWAKLLLALPAVLVPVGILLFILRNELAHDEGRCPYQPLTVEVVAPGVELVEERRSCIDGLEDRRYSVRRDEEVRVLGRRRLPTAAFAAPGYDWHAELRNGQAFLKVKANGHPDAEFREGTPEERAP